MLQKAVVVCVCVAVDITQLRGIWPEKYTMGNITVVLYLLAPRISSCQLICGVYIYIA